ncbi:MAG: hypothetical protein AAGC93_07200 [Cyanobacteria bacterium P01_F01_bin.53]
MTRLPYKKKHWWSPNLDVESLAFWRQSEPNEQKLSAYSRVRRRLEVPHKGDRDFLKLIRRKRAQPSRLNQRLNTEQFRRHVLRGAVLSTFLGLTFGGGLWSALFVKEQVTFGGVPYRVVHKFLEDRPARDAYFGGDRQALHDRLKDLDIEASIKEFYRDDFPDENALDLHIHQIMFDRTGYVGEAYQVNNYGQLSPVKYGAEEPESLDS